MSESTSDETSLERRRAERVPVSIAVEVQDSRGFSIHSSRDLSIGGIFFDRAIPHAVGTKVKLTFRLPGDDSALRCDAEVVNVPNAHEYGMGVRFMGLAAPEQQRLEAFIRRMQMGA